MRTTGRIVLVSYDPPLGHEPAVRAAYRTTRREDRSDRGDHRPSASVTPLPTRSRGIPLNVASCVKYV
jgi:hypothetical protein